MAETFRSHPRVRRRSVLAGLAGMAAAPVAMAQGAAAQGAPKRGGTLKVSVNTRTTSVNPLQISGPSEYLAIDMLFSGLLRMAPDSMPQPDLATGWDSDAAARVFTFHLRPGVAFHDGTPFSAADVVATYRAILDPKTASPARAALGSLKEVEAIDPATVRFTCASSFADFPVATAHANARIVSQAALRDLPGMATRANGTGPFKQDVFDSKRLLRVVRNPAYFVPDQPYLDAVELPLFPDLTAEVQNLLSGATDVMFDVQQADYKRVAAAPGVVGQRVKSGRFVNVVMRMDSKPFDDVRVRNALAMAVDRDTLVELVLEGLGQPARDDVLSPQYRYYAETPAPAYDSDGARKLLAEAGYPNGIRIPLICSNRPAIRSAVGVAMQEMCRPAGFNIDVQTIPHDTYLANVWMKGNFDVGYWGMQATADAAFTLLFTSGAAFADTAWNNKEFDAVVAEAAAMQDEAARRSLYGKAQALMVRDKPPLIPFFQDVLTANRDRVRKARHHSAAAVSGAQGNQGIRGVEERMEQVARAEGISYAQAVRKPRSVVAGTPGSIADRMQEMFEAGACDGFILWPTVSPLMFQEFGRLVVPELQRRGLVQKDYAPGTLREKLQG